MKLNRLWWIINLSTTLTIVTYFICFCTEVDFVVQIFLTGFIGFAQCFWSYKAVNNFWDVCVCLFYVFRLWSCMKSQAEQVQFGAVLIQQADVSVLCLIEALTLSLPQSLLQTYSLFTHHTGLLSPGTRVFCWSCKIFSFYDWMSECAIYRKGLDKCFYTKVTIKSIFFT